MEGEEEVKDGIMPKSKAMRYGKGSAHESAADNSDRISKLPDSLLIDILSRLDMEQVIESRLLSKRWRNVWRTIPCLDLEVLRHKIACRLWKPDIDKGLVLRPEFDSLKIDKTLFIDYVLSHHERTKVRQLHICILYKHEHALRVNSWIRFVSDTNVEEFILELNDKIIPVTESKHIPYKMPHSLYESGSLTKLTLGCCDLNLPASLHLRSLKTLNLHHIQLASDAIEFFTSSSPILEDLFLKDCNRSDNLNIVIKNEHVKNLSIEDYGMAQNSRVTIFAPKVLSLKFIEDMERTYIFKNLQSVTSVDLSEVGDNDDYRFAFEDPYANFSVALVELLYRVGHAREFKLSAVCIRVLSAWKIQGLGLPSIQATNIEWDAGFTKWELPGIAYLLQIASNLEHLSIYILDHVETEMDDVYIKVYDFDENKYWKSEDPSFSSSILTKIRTIVIDGYNRSYTMSEYDINKLQQNEAKFVKFLLKNAKSLERMVITTDSRRDTHEVVKQVSRKLSGFPKASAAAELVVS